MAKPKQPEHSIEELCICLLDSMYDGVIIVDRSERVRYVNDSYTRVSGVPRSEVLGKILHEARPGAMMPTVLKTGLPLLGVYRIIGPKPHVANIVPIFKNEKVIGGASITNNATDILRISDELEQYRKSLAEVETKMKEVKMTHFAFDDIVAVDKESRKIKDTAVRLALKEISILITGESGTGKEVYAQAIHNASKRRNYPFVAINCSAITPNLLESELFGYVDGAFTGAKKGGSPGVFEAANNGTVFLDEIGEMDPAFQPKLLRTLQEGIVRPVGGTREKPVNVRVISATNRDLNAMTADGSFRADLFYRIAPFILPLSPLRERPGDLEALVNQFLAREGEQNLKALQLSPNARKVLMHYSWPGNIRELSNVLSAAAVMVDGEIIDIEDFPKTLQDYSIEADFSKITSLKEAVRRTEHDMVQKALLRYGATTEGKRKAAAALGISVASLYNKLNQP